MKWHWYDWVLLAASWLLWLCRNAVLHGYFSSSLH